jgi:hypothetical protein
MKVRLIVFALVFLFTIVGVCFADNPHMGTWTLNEAKSKIGKGAPKNHTVVYEAAGDQIKVTVDGVDGAGATTHNEWTGKFDNKDYAVTNDATADTRAYRKVNTRTLWLTNKKGGKVTTSGSIVVSRDGRHRTVTTKGRNAKGKLVTTVAFYDKK